MRVPEKDGSTVPNNDGSQDWEDVICDKCGKSCRDKENVNFEYAAIKATWGTPPTRILRGTRCTSARSVTTTSA
jgi:hypothetical protein